MQETTNLKLKKPDLTDYVNVGDLNENSDKIDAAFQTEKERVTTHLADDAKHIQPGERDGWNGKQDALPVEQKRRIFVQAISPDAPQDGDIWIEV